MQLSRILSPLDYPGFQKDYWESQPLHIERSDAQHFENLLSEEAILTFVNNGTARFPEVQAINARKSVPVADYTIDKKSVSPEKMMQCYADGASIVVSEVHKKFLPVKKLCCEFSRDFQMRCQANAYLSPAGNQGFHSHYDTHDVFVLQIAGRKKFRFYPSGIELPFTEDTYTPEHNSGSEVVDEVELSAGDTLYIPRGIVHDAIADEGEPSLHITLGAFPFIMRDLIQEMVQVAAERDVAWRASVDLTTVAPESSYLAQQVNSIFTDANYAEALSRLADEVALEQPSEVIPVPVFSVQSRVSVNRASVYGVERHGPLLKLRLPGQVMSFQEPLSDAVESILSAENMLVSEIPALDNEQKLALCQQLAHAGVIVVSAS